VGQWASGQVESGKWKVESRKWKVESGKWRVEKVERYKEMMKLKDKKKLVVRTLWIVGLLMIAGAFIFAVDGTNPKDPPRELVDSLPDFRDNYMIFAPEVPENASFAGETVPLDISYVWEAFDRELLAFTYRHSTTLRMFKLAHRYFPVIEPILKKNGIPDDFKYLAIAESNLQNVTSPAGAEGVWQFLQATGRKYGLEVNTSIDERYNLKKSTEAACKYLQDAYDEFGNWTLAAAAYNRGMNGLENALNKQRVNNYYDLYLNSETARYVFRILAAKEIFEHPTKYGFYLRESDFYPPIETFTIVVDTTIEDLPSFAKKRGITYRIIREFNPWIHSYSLPNKSRRTYILTLPKKGALQEAAKRQAASGEDQIFGDTKNFNDL
jgi:membrane-bound lytic murein transglycosylase D